MCRIIADSQPARKTSLTESDALNRKSLFCIVYRLVPVCVWCALSFCACVRKCATPSCARARQTLTLSRIPQILYTYIVATHTCIHNCNLNRYSQSVLTFIRVSWCCSSRACFGVSEAWCTYQIKMVMQCMFYRFHLNIFWLDASPCFVEELRLLKHMASLFC